MKYRVSLMVMSLSLLGACADRTHLRQGYGESTRSAMGRQVVNPDAGGTSAGQGLDPQEASVLARNLQRSLSPKDQAPSAGSVIYVSPQAQKAPGDYLPPPSVPSEGR